MDNGTINNSIDASTKNSLDSSKIDNGQAKSINKEFAGINLGMQGREKKPRKA